MDPDSSRTAWLLALPLALSHGQLRRPPIHTAGQSRWHVMGDGAREGRVLCVAAQN